MPSKQDESTHLLILGKFNSGLTHLWLLYCIALAFTLVKVDSRSQFTVKAYISPLPNSQNSLTQDFQQNLQKIERNDLPFKFSHNENKSSLWKNAIKLSKKKTSISLGDIFTSIRFQKLSNSRIIAEKILNGNDVFSEKIESNAASAPTTLQLQLSLTIPGNSQGTSIENRNNNVSINELNVNVISGNDRNVSTSENTFGNIRSNRNVTSNQAASEHSNSFKENYSSISPIPSYQNESGSKSFRNESWNGVQNDDTNAIPSSSSSITPIPSQWAFADSPMASPSPFSGNDGASHSSDGNDSDRGLITAIVFSSLSVLSVVGLTMAILWAIKHSNKESTLNESVNSCSPRSRKAQSVWCMNMA